MEKIDNCDWYSDKSILRCHEKLFYYPDDLMKYTKKVRIAYNELNNCHVKYAVQSEYMIRMSPIDKLIEENKKKMDENSLHVSNDNLREKRKIISRNKLNNQVEQTIKNIIETPINDKSLKSKSSNESSRLTRSRSKLSPCEFNMEDKKTNKRFCKQVSDIEVGLNNDKVDITFSDISLKKHENEIMKEVIYKKEYMEYSNNGNDLTLESVTQKSDSFNDSSNLFNDISQSFSNRDEEPNHVKVNYSPLINLVQYSNNNANETNNEIQMSSNNSNSIDESNKTSTETSEPETLTNKTFSLRLVTPKLLVKSPAFLKLPENKLSKSNKDQKGRCLNKLTLSHNSQIDSDSIHFNKSSENKLSEILKTTDTIDIDESLNKKSALARESNSKLELDRSTIRRKNFFISALGLIDVHKVAKSNKKDTNDEMLKKNVTIQKKSPLKTTEEHLDHGLIRSSSEKLRRSFLLEYSKDKDEKHSAVPILIPERTSGSSFHPGRTCMLKCSYCHGKFGLYDTPCHIAQIKSSEKQIACLENVTHLIGPDSCLCDACFRSIERRSWKRSIQQSGCIILGCIRKSTNILKPQVIEKLKKLEKNSSVVLRDWQYKSEPMPICCLHYEKILTMLQCQLCGNRAALKFELIRDEHKKFQEILDDDQIPFKLDVNFLICKPCRVYLIWRMTEDPTNGGERPDFIVHRDTVVKRICLYNNYTLPSYLLVENSTLNKTKLKEVEPCASEIVSSSPVTINSNNSINCKQIIDPESSSQISLTKNKRPIRQPKNHVAYVDEDTFELFSELQKPYNSYKGLVNHLLAIEKARIDGHLVIADDEEDEKYDEEIQVVGRDKNEKSNHQTITSLSSKIICFTEKNYGKYNNDNTYLEDNTIKKSNVTEIMDDDRNINEVNDCMSEQNVKYFQMSSNESNKLICENKVKKQVECVNTNNIVERFSPVSISPKVIDVLSNTSSSNLVKSINKSSKIKIISDKSSLKKVVPFTSNVRLSLVKPNFSGQVSGTQKLIKFINTKRLTTDRMNSTIASGTPPLWKMNENHTSKGL